MRAEIGQIFGRPRSFFDRSLPALADSGDPMFEAPRVGITDHRLDAGLGNDLSDAAAHGSGANDQYSRDRGQWRDFPFRCCGGYIHAVIVRGS